MTEEADALVVGSGPNGLAAAVVLAAAGLRVVVYECAPSAGGGCRTEELTLPGFLHDVCSAAHPLAVASPFFRRFDLAARGVRLLQPELAFAHPLGGDRAVAAWRSVAATSLELGPDAQVYRRLFGPLVRRQEKIVDAVLSSMRAVPRDPLAAASFAFRGVRSASAIADRFSTARGRAHNRRRLGSRHPAFRPAFDGRLRPAARDARPWGRVARRRRRKCQDHRCDDRCHRSGGRRAPHGGQGEVAGGIAASSRCCST